MKSLYIYYNNCLKLPVFYSYIYQKPLKNLNKRIHIKVPIYLYIGRREKEQVVTDKKQGISIQ